MTSALPIPPPGFDDLSVEEKLDYVQSLWDRIAAHPDDIAVPDWHERVIVERLAAYRASPERAKSKDQVRTDIAEKLKDFRSRRE